MQLLCLNSHINASHSLVVVAIDRLCIRVPAGSYTSTLVSCSLMLTRNWATSLCCDLIILKAWDFTRIYSLSKIKE